MDRYEQKRIFYADSKRGYSDIQLVPNPKGEWVKYSDVKALQSERNHLAVANETLQARVRELEEVTNAFYDDWLSEELTREQCANRMYDRVLRSLKKGTP